MYLSTRKEHGRSVASRAWLWLMLNSVLSHPATELYTSTELCTVAYRHCMPGLAAPKTVCGHIGHYRQTGNGWGNGKWVGKREMSRETGNRICPPWVFWGGVRMSAFGLCVRRLSAFSFIWLPFVSLLLSYMVHLITYDHCANLAPTFAASAFFSVF